MPERRRVAIVDFGLGNLFSVLRACEEAGAKAAITSAPADVAAADGIVLPGVGAFGDAMKALDASGMAKALKAAVSGGKPLLGICLGMQLLMEESSEFGRHEGLGLIPGRVVRFPETTDGEPLKVPHIGWSRLITGSPTRFAKTPLEGLADGAYMYFVHSYYVAPADPAVVVSRSRYASVEFCSSLAWGSVVACQFHPERSGPDGIRIYRNWISRLPEVAHR